MKRIGIVGLCLATAFVLTAVIASAAQAGEYGRCVKAKEGRYTNAGCTEESVTKEGDYEWVPGPGPRPKDTGKTGVATLTGAAGVIECKKSTSTGEITGVKSDKELFTFSKCTTKGAPCTTIRITGVSEKGEAIWTETTPAGSIETFPLNTTLIDHGEKFVQLTAEGEFEKFVEPAEGEAWTLFTSSEEGEENPYKGLQAVYECKEVARIFTGGELAGVTTPVNAMETSLTTTFEEGRGLQDLFSDAEVGGKPPLIPIGRGIEKTSGETKGEEKNEVRTGAGQALKGPTVVTNAASAPSQTSATLNATVDPNGSQVSECEFEYGTTVSYGSTAPCSVGPGSGSSPVAVTASIGGLSENTTYHFRAVARNAGGTSHGSDETFSTLANSGSGETMNPEEPAKAEDGPVTGTASGGTGTVTVGRYTSDPVGAPPAGSSGTYVDIAVGEGSTFTAIEFTDCELNGARKVDWWNPQADGGSGEWQPVSDETSPSGNPPCITVTINETTTPDVADLDGLVFDPLLPEGPAPVIKSLSEKKGAMAGGEEIEITGKAFDEVEAVRFGSTPAYVIEYTSEMIKVISPAHTPETVEVTVTTKLARARRPAKTSSNS